MDYMATIPDNYFELAIVDPPYGIDICNKNIGGRRLKNISVDNKDWDKIIPTKKLFEEIVRVSCEQIIWGANYFNCFLGGMGAIIWDKENPLPSSSRCEIAAYSKHRKVSYYKQTWTNYVNDKYTNHPTEKPIKLYEWLLTNYAKQGDKILDTHLGSGSSAIAANNLGFEFVGMELDEDYFKASVNRFINESKQERMFA